MTKNLDTSTEKKSTQFDMTSCMTMMEKMMEGEGAGCGCAGMMSQGAEQPEIPVEWRKLMSKMVTMCYGKQEENEEEAKKV